MLLQIDVGNADTWGRVGGLPGLVIFAFFLFVVFIIHTGLASFRDMATNLKMSVDVLSASHKASVDALVNQQQRQIEMCIEESKELRKDFKDSVSQISNANQRAMESVNNELRSLSEATLKHLVKNG